MEVGIIIKYIKRIVNAEFNKEGLLCKCYINYHIDDDKTSTILNGMYYKREDILSELEDKNIEWFVDIGKEIAKFQLYKYKHKGKDYLTINEEKSGKDYLGNVKSFDSI
jgi:hypothetical protein